MKHNIFFPCLILLAGLLLSSEVNTADYCVTNGLSFQQALNDAATNAESNHIKLVQGTFFATDSGVNNTGFKWYHNNAQPLVISGGWEMENGQCEAPLIVADPTTTIIHGGLFDRGFEVFVGAAAIDLTLTNLYIKFGSSPPPIIGYLTSGAGIKIASESNDQFFGKVLIDRVMFEDNFGINASALYINGAEHLVIRNSVFHKNRPSHYGTALIHVPDGGRAYFVNNVSRGNNILNQVDDPHAAIEFLSSPNSQVMVANNIFWANSGQLDILFSGDQTAERWLVKNMIYYLDGELPTVDQDNFIIQVLTIGNDWIPYVDSIFVNTAFHPEPNLTHLFEHDWQPGPVDLKGQPRVYGGGLDIGAAEHTSRLVFKSGFD